MNTVSHNHSIITIVSCIDYFNIKAGKSEIIMVKKHGYLLSSHGYLLSSPNSDFLSQALEMFSLKANIRNLMLTLSSKYVLRALAIIYGAGEKMSV